MFIFHFRLFSVQVSIIRFKIPIQLKMTMPRQTARKSTTAWSSGLTRRVIRRVRPADSLSYAAIAARAVQSHERQELVEAFREFLIRERDVLTEMAEDVEMFSQRISQAIVRLDYLLDDIQ